MIARPHILVAILAVASVAMAAPARAQPPVSAPAPAVVPPAPAAGTPGGASVFTKTMTISLAETVALMLRDNRTVRSVLLSRIVDDFNLRVAEDQFNPQFALSLSARRTQPQRGPGDPRSRSTLSAGWEPSVSWLLPYGTQILARASGGVVKLEGSDTIFDQGLDVSILQPLLRGAGQDVVTASLEISRLNRRIQTLGTERSITGNIVLAIQSYRSLMQSGEQVKIAEDSLRRARDLVAVNRQLVAAGRLAAVEIVQSEANVARQELSLLTARNSFDATRLDLLQILALDLQIGLTPTERLSAARVQVDLQKALEIARANRADYRQAFMLVEVSKLNLRLAEDGLRWELNAIGSASVNSSDRTFSSTVRRGIRTEPGFTAGLELRIPISNLSDQARAVSARIALQQQELSLADLEQRLQVQVLNALRTTDISWQQLQLAELSVQLSEQKLGIERERLRAGRSSNFQVVTFEDDLVRARTDLLASRIGYLNSLTALDDVLGVTLQTWGVRLEAL